MTHSYPFLVFVCLLIRYSSAINALSSTFTCLFIFKCDHTEAIPVHKSFVLLFLSTWLCAFDLILIFGARHQCIALFHIFTAMKRLDEFETWTKLTSAKIKQNKAQIQSDQTVLESLLYQFNWHNARVQKKEDSSDSCSVFGYFYLISNNCVSFLLFCFLKRPALKFYFANL